MYLTSSRVQNTHTPPPPPRDAPARIMDAVDSLSLSCNGHHTDVALPAQA